MSFKANQLFVLASNFEALASEFLEKNAKDIEQPEAFEEDYHKWLKRNRKDSPTTVREMKAIKTPAPPELIEELAPKYEAEEPEITHEEWAEKNPRMSDWSDKDWSKYLKKDDNKAEDKPKLDPRAKVRNRGTVCVPASSAKDKKDHFPINNEAQARNALARVHQYDKVPSWYSGSLKSLQELVSRKVHSKYKGIGKSEKKKSSSVEINQTIITKYS